MGTHEKQLMFICIVKLESKIVFIYKHKDGDAMCEHSFSCCIINTIKFHF